MPKHGMRKILEGHKRKGRLKPSRSSVRRAAHEVKHNPPAILAKTRKKKGKKAARRQEIAIILSKARRGK